TMRLSFAFSASSSRSRFTSAGSNSPKRLRQPYSVCSLILCLRATSATGMRSASRRIATICSSVNLLFLMGSSPRGESHSLNLSVRRKFRAGHTLSGNLSHINRPADRGMLTLDFLHARRNILQGLEKNPRLRLYEGGTCGGGMTARQQAIFTLDGSPIAHLPAPAPTTAPSARRKTRYAGPSAPGTSPTRGTRIGDPE